MEGPYSSGATAAFREVGLEGPTKHVAIVSVVSNQPQVRLQMEASLRTRRSAGVVGSAPSSWSLASANEREMVEANSPDAAAPSELGKSQTASSLGQGVQRATRPGGAHDWRVAQKTQTQPPRSSTFSPRAADEPWRVDGGCSKQSSMDGGFQRMVSNARWSPGGAVDGAGLAQPLSAEYPIVARSKVGAGAANLSAVVRTVRLSPGHPRRQRWSVWIERPGGAFAFERLVDGVGNLGGIHCSRPSRTERWARANASSDEGRNHSAALAQSARAAAPDGSVGRGLQPSAPPRSPGPAGSGGGVPSESAAPEERDLEISPAMGGATGPEQRADQVARTKTLRRGSIRRIPSGPQTGSKEMGDLFRSPAGWRTLGTRCGWNAPGQVCSSPMRNSRIRAHLDRERSRHERSELPRERTSRHALRAVPLRGECYRTHRSAPPPAGRSSAGGMEGRKCYPCLCLKCYPCPCPPPTLTLSLSKGRGRTFGGTVSGSRKRDPRWLRSGSPLPARSGERIKVRGSSDCIHTAISNLIFLKCNRTLSASTTSLQ